MSQNRRLRAALACLLVFALAIVLGGGGGCANGGDTSTGGGDGGSASSDVTLESGGGETGSEASGCGAGKTMCGSTCTNTGNDPKNCGMCGNACPMGQVCSTGMCGFSCSSGETLCGLPPEGGAGGMDSSGGGAADTGAQDATHADSGTGEAGSTDSGSPSSDAGGPTQPFCANTNNDPNNCGGCGIVCGTGETCQNGSCACGQGEKICIASQSCIPTNSCCNSGDCTVPGEICPSPGGMCACPNGERVCAKTNSCISSNDCCTASDCMGIMGATCPTPGQACQCSNGNKLCIKQMICVPPTSCCTPEDCSAPNAQTYDCSTTSSMAGTCSILTCNPNCANLDGQYANGCECCDDTTVAKSCASATQIGPNPLQVGGGATTMSGTLPTGDSDWYQVTFSGESNTAFHALVQLTTGAGEYVFDILQGSCNGGPMTCGEGGNCTSKTAWEESYSGVSPPADPTDPTFKAIPAVGTLFIRVYRANPAMPTCNPYTLSVQE